MTTSNETARYVAPELHVHGSLEKLTQGANGQNALDATFLVGTPRGQVTFS